MCSVVVFLYEPLGTGEEVAFSVRESTSRDFLLLMVLEVDCIWGGMFD